MLAAMLGAVAYAAVADDMELLTTRTMPPEPSAALITALQLTVPEWEGDATQPKVKLSADDLKRADEAGLRALDALPAAAMTNDFDRAWVAFARGRTLEALGRREEAMEQYRRLRTMPRTNVLDRYALAHMHAFPLHRPFARDPARGAQCAARGAGAGAGDRALNGASLPPHA